MKKLLDQYAAYNLYANQRIVDVVENLSDEQLHRPIESSFPSIFKTLNHLMEVEAAWWDRVKLVENPFQPGQSFEGSVMELGQQLIAKSKQWREWVSLATEAALEHEFIYRNSKKQQFKQPVFETVHHLFNHQTFHRGQLITMLRQVGVKELPNTDLVSFLRKK